ncbi:uncharacterized protein PV06_07470 [Exophiala oligosperma]|uniref:Uncharacterized protein n=1 Tax=Exophiala oligosperma TaxID=215243 RepID=A0A0D2BS24_9EURO|nr:uncharacterized protein PV06_07470 [Exophiala oligosperma]KIW40257.1 hypothetical protein PV06_07470 [Exophiala oligosperma]
MNLASPVLLDPRFRYLRWTTTISHHSSVSPIQSFSKDNTRSKLISQSSDVRSSRLSLRMLVSVLISQCRSQTKATMGNRLGGEATAMSDLPEDGLDAEKHTAHNHGDLCPTRSRRKPKHR